jgi:hypothetical protein
MAQTHDMIVTYVAGKMQRLGFEIKFMEGNHVNVKIERPELPPTIITHRPDIFALRNGAIGIGEAKTKSDLKSNRTKTQLLDFKKVIRDNSQNRLFLGIPQNAKDDLVALLHSIGVNLDEQIDIMSIPDILLPSNGKV